MGSIWISNTGEIYVNGRNSSHGLGISEHDDDIKIPILFKYFKQKSDDIKPVTFRTAQEFSIALCDDGSVWSAGT